MGKSSAFLDWQRMRVEGCDLDEVGVHSEVKSGPTNPIFLGANKQGLSCVVHQCLKHKGWLIVAWIQDGSPHKCLECPWDRIGRHHCAVSYANIHRSSCILVLWTALLAL